MCPTPCYVGLGKRNNIRHKKNASFIYSSFLYPGELLNDMGLSVLTYQVLSEYTQVYQVNLVIVT